MSHPSRRPSLLHQAAEPLFLLNRQRRLLFVNPAWITLTGLTSERVLRQTCRRRHATAGSPEALLATLAPPSEVLDGQPGHVRRLLVRADGSRRWCDVDFLCIHDSKGRRRILGKITPLEAETVPPPRLSENLAALRAEVVQRYRLDQLDEGAPILRRVAAQARLAGQTRAPVLIVGPTGSGKEWLARAIHAQGSAPRPFAALDCVRLPAPALAGVLFGGTAAAARDPTGTVYLKDVTHLPRDVQARLCDWLGSSAPRPRLLAGTATDPAAEVQAGRLLEELHCALGTVVITLPPLRERRAELPVLVERLLQRANGDGEKSLTGLTPDAWEFLRDYTWPGNLRELFAVLRSARRRGRGDKIDTGDLPAHLRQAVILDRTPGRIVEQSLPLDQLLEQVERRLIVLALRMTRGKKGRAAELLSLSVPRLLRRMETLGISVQYD